MATAPRSPIVNFIPDFPKREPLSNAWRRWWQETIWYVRHTLTPIERTLPPAARQVTLPDSVSNADDLKRSLESMRKLVDAAEARATLIRTKANGLLGIVALVTPLLSWWLVSGRDRLSVASLWAAVPAYVMVLTAFCLALALLAMFRTQRVVTFPSLTLEHVVDLETGHLKVHDPALEVQTLASVWGSVERWSDVLADYLRAGQRFLGLSLIFAITAGSVAYLHPEATKTTGTVVQASGNPAIQTGAATIEVARTSSTADLLLASIISMLFGAGIVLLFFFVLRRSGP